MSTVHYQSCNLQNKVILVYIWATRPLGVTLWNDPSKTLIGIHFLTVRRRFNQRSRPSVLLGRLSPGLACRLLALELISMAWGLYPHGCSYWSESYSCSPPVASTTNQRTENGICTRRQDNHRCLMVMSQGIWDGFPDAQTSRAFSPS
jgi:hypothetical protein